MHDSPADAHTDAAVEGVEHPETGVACHPPRPSDAQKRGVLDRHRLRVLVRLLHDTHPG